jgi:hypothetical protein
MEDQNMRRPPHVNAPSLEALAFAQRLIVRCKTNFFMVFLLLAAGVQAV